VTVACSQHCSRVASGDDGDDDDDHGDGGDDGTVDYSGQLGILNGDGTWAAMSVVADDGTEFDGRTRTTCHHY